MLRQDIEQGLLLKQRTGQVPEGQWRARPSKPAGDVDRSSLSCSGLIIPNMERAEPSDKNSAQAGRSIQKGGGRAGPGEEAAYLIASRGLMTSRYV